MANDKEFFMSSEEFYGIWRKNRIMDDRDFSGFYMQVQERNSEEGRGIGTDRIGKFEFSLHLSNEGIIEVQKRYVDEEEKIKGVGKYQPNLECFSGSWSIGKIKGIFNMVPRKTMRNIRLSNESTKEEERILSRLLLECEFELAGNRALGNKIYFPFTPQFPRR